MGGGRQRGHHLYTARNFESFPFSDSQTSAGFDANIVGIAPKLAYSAVVLKETRHDHNA